MKRKIIHIVICILVQASFFLSCAFAEEAEKTKVNVLIVPKFEIGEISGDKRG